MKLRPGRHAIACAAAAAVICCACFLVPWIAWTLPALAVAVLAAAAADYRQLRRQLSLLAATRHLPSACGRGALLNDRILLQSENDSPVRGEFRDELPAGAEPQLWVQRFELAAGQSRSFTLPIRIRRRGKHTFGSLWIRTFGRWGMLEAQTARDLTQAVRVLPESLADRTQLEQRRGEQMLLDRRTRERLHGVGTEFESLTEFREGDDPRRIDWRATARMSRLIARRYQLEQHREVMLLIDSGRLMGADIGGTTKLDQAVNAGLLLGRAVLQRGDHVGVGVFDARVRAYLKPQSDASAFHRLRDQLYDLQSQMLETDFGEMFALVQHRQRKRAMLIVLSDLPDLETTERFRTALLALRRRHLVLFVALQTPQLSEALLTPIERMHDVARGAVIFRLLRQREQALHALTRSGIHVLDVEPDRLSVPLIEQYISLREQNLL